MPALQAWNPAKSGVQAAAGAQDSGLVAFGMPGATPTIVTLVLVVGLIYLLEKRRIRIRASAGAGAG